MQNNTEKKQAYKERERYRQQAFLMMLQVAVIIALPAFAAFFLGKYLDQSNPDSKTWTTVLLVVSFFLSWAIIIAKYIKFNKKVKEVDKKIRDLKEKDVHNSNSGRKADNKSGHDI